MAQKDVNDKMFRMTSERLLMPKEHNNKGGENVKKGTDPMKVTPKGTSRAVPSSKVGRDSLPGWVKRNMNDIEVTEGRL